MNKIYFLFTILISLICFDFKGQSRYLDQVFNSTVATNNIVYAVNQSVALGATSPVPTGATVPIGLDTTTTPPTPILFSMPALEMDIFEPSGDNASERPLIIYLHTGDFAPIIRNGNATGSRTFDYATQTFCNEYAKRGYVVANTDYRFGWNPLLPTEPERASSFLKAVYRGVQDAKAAVRFLREDYENGNTYRIDTSKIIIVGEGTGGHIALAFATIDKLSELHLPKFLDQTTGVPLLDTAVLGDWDGYGGSPAYNTPSNIGYSNKVHMVCNMGGMLMDLSWLEAGDVPIAAVHGNLDAFARFTTGNTSVSGVNVNIISNISGSHDVVKKANILGNNVFINNTNDIYTIAAQNASNNLIGTQDFSGVVINDAPENLFPFVTGNSGEGAPWEYFDSLTSVLLAVVQGFPASVGTNAYMSSLATNPDVSFAKANAYIDSTLGFFTHKIYKTFFTTCIQSTSSVSNLYCGSYLYNGQTYFTPNNFYDTLTNANGCDSIIINSFTRNITYGIDTIISCSSYTWIDGNTYTSSNNTASYTIRTAAGCDSIITLNLTINSNQFNADFTVNQTLFTAPPFAAQFTNTTPNPSNYNFTWDFSDGTILQSNNPSVFHQFLNNGLYSVTLIAENILTGCTDTMFKDDFIFCAGGTSCTHASTINQTGPITGCLSDSIFLTCNTDPTFSYQWRLNGTYIPGAIDTIYYPTQSGNYSVLISQNSCPEVSSDISVTVSPTPNTPFITSSGTLLPCQASSVTLSVPNNFATYSWSSGGTASSEVISSSGSYFVSVTNSGGCASTSLPFNVNASFVQPPDVCIVGVNPQTNFNRVIWEHPNSTAIDSFYVYKETNQANIYQKIGGTAFNDTAIFDDVSSNPAVQAYRYKLSLVDSCGVESALGDFHKTIHLTINQGIGSAWNLIWSGYEGFTYPSYNIYRGANANNMVLLTTIASNLNSYTDLTAPAGQLYYQIEVVSSFSCDPSRSFNTSRSNIVENGVVSCNNTGTDIISSCDSITWIDGVVYTASNNNAAYTLTNSAGCDSIVTLDLTINQTLSGTDVISSCDIITWIDGITYSTNNNTATFTLQTANGCDSVITLNLTISPSTTDFNYGGATTFCLGGTNPIATIIGDSLGIFTATGGLVIDSLTGQIDLSTATAGNYQLTYTPRSSGIWQQKGLDIDGESVSDFSGSVSINASGEILAIGAFGNNGNGANSGHVRIFNWNGTAWIQLGLDIDGEAAADNSGQSVSMNASGDRVAIGADYNDGTGSNAGHVRIYEWNGTAWTQLGLDIDGEAAADRSGCSVSMNANGDRLAIGALGNDGTGSNAGHVRIFNWDGTAWIQLGLDIDGEAAGDRSGQSVSMNAAGDRVAIGADYNDGNGLYSGHVRIFNWNGTAWTQLGLDIDGEAAADRSGCSVSMNAAGDRLAIGANQNDGTGSNAGHVRIYQWDGIAWTQLGLDIDGEAAADRSGCSISMNANGDRLAIGANQNDGTGSNAGHVRIYQWDGTAWIKIGQDIDAEAAGDNSGGSVSMNANGDRLAIGASSNDENGTNAGHVRLFESPTAVCSQPLNITISETTYGTDVISSCDSITWIDGFVYTASNNNATYTLTNSAGCDSIVTLDLTINQTLSGTDVISSCDSITWIDGITYTASNNSATFTIQTANGCDSTVTLNLTINQGSTGTDVISSCDSITWIDGITYTASNNSATFTIQTANGCDSIVTLNLTINQGSTGTDVISSCDSITWIDGITYTTSNNSATFTLQTANGCDSIVTLNLTISSGFLSEETLSACDSLLWSVNGNTYTQNGIYYDSLQSSNGCDSLYKLDLIVNSSSSSLFSTSSCLSYSWNGQTLLATGIYIDTNVNAAGCLQYDSLDLTITTTPNVFNEVACDSFAWNGTSYTTSGTYTTSGACVDTLNLTINNFSTSISSLSSCDSVNWNGLTYSVTGIYNFITTNSVGCDSTATLNLNIDSGSVSQLSITSCDSYLWNGTTYSQSGTYYDSLQNTTGCDSTLVLNLTVDSSTTTTLSEVACNTYFWNNNSYTSSGNYRDTLQNVNGCDSVVSLNLTINNSSSSLINITACDSYSWNGTSYNVTGIYYDSLQTASGCDSIQTLNLTINNSTNNTINISACDTYSWNGVSYNVSGTYTYSSLTASGCDSIVTLNLTINNSYSNTDTINSCNSYSWNGTTYNQSGTYYDSSSTVNGCDSINILSLIVSGNIFSLDTAAACQSYIWNGNQYDSSGIYIDTITSLVGCDSIKTLYLTINDDVTSPITLELLLDDYCLETYWNVKDSQDSVWYSGQNYNCNPSGGGTQANAIINKKMYLDPNDCYTFELGDVFGDGLGASFWGGVDGSWLIKDFNNLVIGQGQGDFGFIVEYSFLVGQSFVTNVIENEALQPSISIYPNPTNENITISIENFTGNIQTEVYDLIGNRLQTTNKTTISLSDYARGIYLLKVAYGDRVEEVKVIKD